MLAKYLKFSLCVLALCLVGFGPLGPVGFVQADVHHNGASKILGKGDGHHTVHTTTHGHVAIAHVKGGKVQGLTVHHKGKTLPVKKFSTTKKLHAMADPWTGGQFAMLEGRDVLNVLAAHTDADAPSVRGGFGTGSMFVGFAFFDQSTQQWVIIWFPANMVMGGATGATPFPSGGINGGQGGINGGQGGINGGQGGGNPAPQGTTILNENGNLLPFPGLLSEKDFFVQLQSGATYTITLTATSGGLFPQWLLFQTATGTSVKMTTSGGSNKAQAVVSVNNGGLYKIACFNDNSNNPGGSGNFNLTVVQN
jgi:hypothetical protein